MKENEPLERANGCASQNMGVQPGDPDTKNDGLSHK